MAARKKKKAAKKRGPKPEHLKIDGDWEAAVRKAVGKRPPNKVVIKEKPPKKGPIPGLEKRRGR